GAPDPKSATGTVNVTVTAVNDAPAGADGSVSTPEDTPRTITPADLGFSDAADTPPNNYAGVVVTTLPAAGTLTDNGVPATASQFAPAAGPAADLVVYAPAADGNGSPSASSTFQVRDDGGTANGGIDTDPTPRTLTVDVTPVNDAPSFTKGPDQTVG